jgi:hypothetical protein
MLLIDPYLNQLTVPSIVAIHGLNPWNKEDHAILTWQDKKSGHLWLQQSLPKSQPNARVLLYSYESSPVFGASQERFIYQANSLLECLRLVRLKVAYSLSSRPLSQY